MRNGNVLVDHVFMLIEADEVDATVQNLERAGVVESSRRSHRGLGTSNIFFCFDNIFLEILWVADRAEAVRTQLGRLLLERLDGRFTGAAPFGIGFRTLTPEAGIPFETWVYEPPAVLGYKSIPIAHSSLCRTQPLLFRAQRTAAPDAWTDGNAGARQKASGFAEITHLSFIPSAQTVLGADLRMLQKLGMIELKEPSNLPGMVLTLRHHSGRLTELSLRSPFAAGVLP